MKKLVILFFLLSSVTLFGKELKILYPNGGERIFLNRNTETIRWKADKSVGEIVILLYRKGVKLFEIKNNVKTDPTKAIQTFIWRFDPKLKEGDGYRIRIRSLKNLSINDFSDRDFLIARK